MHDALPDSDVVQDAAPSEGAQVDPPSAGPTPSRRTGLLVMLFVIVLLIVAGIVWAVVSAVGNHPDRDASGAFIESGRLSVNDLRMGDCFQQPGDPTVQTEAGFVDAVPCAQPHDAEVFAEESLPEPEGAEYPGEEAAFTAGADACLDDFEGFIGIPLANSVHDVFLFIPSEDTWPAGDRRVVCAVYDPEGAALTGSLEGSRR